MKSKKQLLKFFLEKLELWETFENQVNSHFDLPEWDNIDENLDFLFKALGLLLPEDSNRLIAGRLKDKTYLDQLINNEDLGQWTLVFALQELCEFAGLASEDPRVWNSTSNQVSIMEYIDKVYRVANG